MRLLAIAIATGVAIAAGMLGFREEATGYIHQDPQSSEAAGQRVQAAVAPDQHMSSLPGRHSDAHTASAPVDLNQNVIDGAPTTVCRVEADIRAAMPAAIAAWTDLLPNIAGGAVLQPKDPGSTTTTTTGRATGTC